MEIVNKAKNSPIVKSGAMESQEIEISGSSREIDIGIARAGGLPQAELEVEPVYDPAKLDMEKFMAEELVVTIHAPANKEEAQAVYVGHPLTAEHERWKPRNRPIRLKRYEVDILIRAKGTKVEQRKGVQDEEGFEGYREFETARLEYPFRVESDPSGEVGRRWLATELSKPA